MYLLQSAIHARLHHPVVILCFALLASLAAAQPDFTGMSDVEVLMHEDRVAGIAEFQKRAKDYPPEKIRDIEREYFKQRMTPRERDLTAEEHLAIVNTSANIERRMKALDDFKTLYDTADDSEKVRFRDAYLDAWAEVPFVPYSEGEDSTVSENRSRFWFYAREFGNYVQSEEEFLSILEERCLGEWGEVGRSEFLTALLGAKIPLGSLTAVRMEKLYNDMNAERTSPMVDDGEYLMIGQIHRVLGRCGEPGLEVVQRLGTASQEYGIWSLGLNSAPEAERLLWEMYEETPENSDRTRLNILRELSGRRSATPQEQGVRQARIRQELTPYLRLPEGQVNLWNVNRAVALAKDTGDPFYLPHISAMREALSQLPLDEIVCPGMDDRMEEMIARVNENFDSAVARLGEAQK